VKADLILTDSRVRSQLSSEDRWLIILLSVCFALVCAFLGIALAEPSFWLIAALAIALLIAYEPRLGLYLVWSCIGLDSVQYDPLAAPFAKLYQGLPGLLATPIELLLLWTLVATILRWVSTGEWHSNSVNSLLAAGALSTLLVMAIVLGVNNGGNFTIALWETRAVLLVLPVMLITAALLTERKHVYQLMAVAGLALSLMTAELAWRYFFLLRPGEFDGVLEQAFNHDGAVLVAFLAVAGVAACMWCPKGKHRLAAFLIAVLAVVVVLVSRRRSAVICLEGGLLVIGTMLLMTNWRRFMLACPIVILAIAIYAGAFWNNQGSLGQPVRGFRAVFDSSAQSERDRQSDQYRVAERLDVWLEIKARPVQGMGFGLAYAKPYPFPDLTSIWPFWPYIPHNNILWLWMKGGVFTFLSFWLLTASTIARASRLGRATESGLMRVLAVSVCSFMVMMVLYSYVDLGLQSPRLMILFGGCIGLLSVVERLWQPVREPGDVAIT
jgi:hypothetical protein